ncbi:MAG: amidohydrolase family protein [Gaiellaceae bacterium]|jgi:predicted TIM-barrel fold metal-dependent hydrolase
MEEELARAEALIEVSGRELLGELPLATPVFDAHVHLGTDVDGMIGSFEELTAICDRYGIERCFAFALDEPDRHPAFSKPNDRTLAHAQRSRGRLIPFVRLDLAESPLEEAERCLDLGARGIKLHPRSQGFKVNDERLEPIVSLAAERGVPVLIHGGRGLPPIADHLARLVERYPLAQLIVAHAGIADLDALAHALGGKPGVFFDTSVWSPIDLLDFYRQVAPEQIVYASDFPYGQQPSSLLMAIRTARFAGFNEDELRMILWENADRISRGESSLAPSAPHGNPIFSQSMTMARIHQYLSMATPLLWTRQQDTVGALGLALNACCETDTHPHDRDRIGELLICARDLWRTLPELEREPERVRANRLTFRLIHLADILAVTSGV